MSDAEQIKSEVLAIPEQARSIVINDVDSYKAAGKFLNETIKQFRKKLADVFGPMKTSAVATHKAILAQEKAAEAPLIEAEGIVKRAILVYEEAQNRIRLAEQARLQEIARKQDEERRLAEAEALEKQGNTQAAEAVIAAPANVPVVTIAPQTPKLAGVSFVERWDFDIVDANAIPREYLLPDMVKIRRVVTALKGETRIPGIVARSHKTVSARAV